MAEWRRGGGIRRTERKKQQAARLVIPRIPLVNEDPRSFRHSRFSIMITLYPMRAVPVAADTFR